MVYPDASSPFLWNLKRIDKFGGVSTKIATPGAAKRPKKNRAYLGCLL
jgi:hypothetical protein